jgi:hypothetical protein
MPNCVTYVPGILCNLCLGKLNIFHCLMALRQRDCPLPGVPWPEAPRMKFRAMSLGLRDWGTLVWGIAEPSPTESPMM